MVEFKDLKGLIIKSIKVVMEDDDGVDRIEFTAFDKITNIKRRFELFHEQDCCECCYIVDICGNINALIGHEILLAELITNSENSPTETAESSTWSFYKLSTIKGSVTIRWLGESNGYYSETVTFKETPMKENEDKN